MGICIWRSACNQGVNFLVMPCPGNIVAYVVCCVLLFIDKSVAWTVHAMHHYAFQIRFNGMGCLRRRVSHGGVGCCVVFFFAESISVGVGCCVVVFFFGKSISVGVFFQVRDLAGLYFGSSTAGLRCHIRGLWLPRFRT